MNINLDDVITYFSFLCGSNSEQGTAAREIFTVSFLDKESKTAIYPHGVFHGTIEEIVKKATELQNIATLHAVLNITDMNGRRKKNIQGVRVFCVDLDTVTDKDTLKYWIATFKIQMVVESSPGKYHLYWKCAETIPLNRWKLYQLGLAYGFSGDLHLDDITKTIRVPGISRIGKDGKVGMPRIVYLDVEDREDLQEDSLENVFPQVSDWITEGKRAKEAYNKQVAENAKLLMRSRPKRKGFLDLDTDTFQLQHSLPGSIEANGSRNVTLFKAVYDASKSIQFAADGSLLAAIEESNAVSLAYEYNKAFSEPLEDNEVEAIAVSAWERGNDAHRSKVKRMGRADAALDEAGGTEVDCEAGEAEGNAGCGVNSNGQHEVCEKESSLFEYQNDVILKHGRFTEMSLSDRCIQRFGSKMVRVGKSFYAFDEERKVWSLQTWNCHPCLFAFYQECALDLIDDPKFVETCTDKNGEFSVTKYEKQKERFLSLNLHTKTVKSLFNWPEIKFSETSSMFDADPELLFVANGVLNMRTGELRQPRAEDYLLSRSPINYVVDAACPEFIKFLYQVFSRNSDAESMVTFTQELFGYSLSGYISEQKINCHYGSGSNGKSKILSALMYIAGEYATVIEPDEFVAKKNGIPKSFERFGAKLESRRIVVIDDLDTETCWNEGFVKTVTGTKMRAADKYEQTRVFTNRCKIHVGLNTIPKPQAENFGVLRRMCIIPYLVRFNPTATESERIDAIIENEAEGILAWAIKGFQKYLLSRKLSESEDINLAIEDYKTDNFALESIVKVLFVNSEKYIFVSDITQAVNGYNRKNDPQSTLYTASNICSVIEEVFQVKPKKVWHTERKNNFKAYPLAWSALEIESELKNDLMSNIQL